MYKTPHRQLLDYFKDRNLKCTAQRLLVLDVLLKSKAHATAEEILAMARDADSGLGLATVYRTLKILEEAGLVASHSYEDGVARFESLAERGHHGHLVCESCGKVLDVWDTKIESAQNRVALNEGFEVTSRSMYLYGLCPDCRNKRSQRA